MLSSRDTIIIPVVHKLEFFIARVVHNNTYYETIKCLLLESVVLQDEMREHQPARSEHVWQGSSTIERETDYNISRIRLAMLCTWTK